MFPIAGQTAGPNGLKFFEDTHGPWVAKGRQRQKIDYFYFFFFHGQGRVFQLVFNIFVLP